MNYTFTILLLILLNLSAPNFSFAKKKSAEKKTTNVNFDEDEFDYDKFPSHYKQTWLFTNLHHAQNFYDKMKKNGWEGEIKKTLALRPAIKLYFADSTDKNFITKISEELTAKNIPNSIEQINNKYYLQLGEFLDNRLLILQKKYLYSNQVKAFRTSPEQLKLLKAYALELRKKPSTGFFSNFLDSIKNQRYTGKLLNESAYTPEKPGAWAKIKNFLHLNAFNTHTNFEWKLAFHLIYDAVFDSEDIYPKKVKEDQQFDALPDEIYLKYFNKNWFLQAGYINLKWGHLLDTYVADVLNPKDLRDFILPRESSRDLPFLGLRFNLNFDPHNFEVVWLPTPSVDKISRWGSIYHPVDTQAYSPNTITEEDPASLPSDMGFGARYFVDNTQLGGSLFYLRSVNHEARFIRTLQAGSIASIQQKHFPITRMGATFDYTLSSYQMHLETMYIQDDKVPTTLSADIDGLVSKNSFQLGYQLIPHWFSNTDITLQYIIKSYLDHTSDLMVDENEQYASIEIKKYFFNARWVPKITAHFGTQRGDSLIRPRLQWLPLANLNLTLGYDFFSGETEGTFGHFDKADRYYLETEFIF
ncbi:MAG: hypothetical protein KDD40_08515 [Bdellovibrionales bacterium]|nr:hypothetical protein [Bdellovibrionales bacterium]